MTNFRSYCFEVHATTSMLRAIKSRTFSSFVDQLLRCKCFVNIKLLIIDFCYQLIIKYYNTCLCLFAASLPLILYKVKFVYASFAAISLRCCDQAEKRRQIFLCIFFAIPEKFTSRACCILAVFFIGKTDHGFGVRTREFQIGPELKALRILGVAEISRSPI